MTYIEKLSEGQGFSGLHVLVEQCALKEDRKGKTFAALVLRDSNKDTIAGRLWNYNADTHYFLEGGAVVEVSGSVNSWQGEIQISVNSIQPSSRAIEEFAKSSRLNIEEANQKVLGIIEGFEDPFLKAVAGDLYDMFGEQFRKAPAALGIHNAWYGGLIEHSLAMCETAVPVIDYYNGVYGDKIDKNTVLFGCIFHDLGKIVEYDFSSPAFKPNPEGVLIPHIVWGPAVIYEVANKHKDKVAEGNSFEMQRAHLMHLTASHHGKAEWGSPVAPASLEAIILHHVDLLDARVMHAVELMEKGEGAVPGFTDKSWVEGTRFLKD